MIHFFWTLPLNTVLKLSVHDSLEGHFKYKASCNKYLMAYNVDSFTYMAERSVFQEAVFFYISKNIF